MKQFEGYEEYLKQSELSKQTRQVYLREAEKFVRYLNGKEITKDRTMLYREKLREEDLSPATINLYVIAVNRYLRYLECGQASIKTLKVQKKRSVENVISRKEYQELLNYAKSSGRKKYYYIMRTLALTGIRVSELQYITVETLETGRVQVYNKGKIRDVYLPDVLIRELKKFCREEKENDGIIFRGRGGDPINRITVYKMIAYEKTVSVKVVQLATGVSIEDENGPISTTVEMATTDKKALTAKVAAGSGSDTVSNAKVTWTSSDSSKVKVTATGDNEAVITAVSKTEAGKEVTITATTTDGTQKVGEIKVAVKEGINADSISFDSKLPEITYEGAGDLEDYYKDYVAALNKKTTIGTYSIKDTSETIDSVGGVDKTSTVASLKTNTENSQTIKNGLTIVFTLSDDAGLTPVDGKTKWNTKTVEKTYDVVINRAVINRDASAVTGKLESSYAAGAKLSEILAGKNVTEFDIEVQKKVDGAWKTIADKDLENEIPNIGTLANYQVKYSLKDSAKTVYTLSGADANGYKYVSLSGISITQPVLTDVKAENVSEKLTADKFKDGDTLKLKASYNEKKLGSANYTTSYQWYKLNEKTNKYVAISTTDNPTADKATLEVSKIADIPGTYYCEITADVNGSVKNFLPDATDAQVEAYSKLVKSTNKVTVEATKITVDTTTSGLGLSKTEATYGATADVKAIAKVTADDVSAYRVYYKQVTTVANKPSLGEAKDITKKSVNEDEAFLFKSGRTISESLGNLDAGTYRIYLEVTAGKETRPIP